MSPTVGLLITSQNLTINKYKDILIWVIVCLDLLLVTGMEMQTWSECTRKMIDAEFERREAMDYNCFLT